MNVQISNKTFLTVTMTILFIFQPTDATENCTFLIPQECQCFSDQLLDIFIDCTYENNSVISKFLQEPSVDILVFNALTMSSTAPLTLPKEFFKGIKSIHSIKVVTNSLTEIPEAIFLLANISVLDFSYNSIEIFNASSMNDLPYFPSVNLRYNRINNIIDTGTIRREENVIEEIDLSHNLLTDVSNLRLWSRVRHLDISSNKITRILNVSSSSIEKLDMSDNTITEVENNTFFSMPNLKILNISHNRISVLHSNSFYGLRNLQHLDISKNSLTSIAVNTFLTVTRLITLQLSQNNLLDLHAGSYVGLEYSLKGLSLSGNKIHYVDQDTFRSLHNLTVLDISHNRNLQNIEEVMYPPLISSLDFRYCAISRINECQFFGLEHLASLKLTQNNLPCHCHTKALYTWYKQLKEHSPTVVQEDGNDWLCVDNAGVYVPVYSSLTSESCSNQCKSKETEAKHVMEIEINIDTHHESIVAEWKINNASTIYGLKVHVKTNNDQIIESPLIHKDARKYKFRMEIRGVTEFTLCLEVLGNRTAVIEKVCHKKEVPLDTAHMVTGIVAGVVFLIPCLFFFLYIVYKDHQYYRNGIYYQDLQEEGKVDHKDTSWNPQEEKTVLSWAESPIHKHGHSAEQVICQNDIGRINTKDLPMGIRSHSVHNNNSQTETQA